MEDRNTTIVAVRPKLELDVTNSVPEEKFQNEVLRPILKLQHNVLVLFFTKTTLDKKHAFDKMHEKAQYDFILHSLQSNAIVRNTLLGMVIGLFTADELHFYLDHQDNLRRRIISMLADRLFSVLHPQDAMV